MVSAPPFLMPFFFFTFPALSFDPLAAGLAFLDGLFTHNLWWPGGDALVLMDDGAGTSRPCAPPSQTIPPRIRLILRRNAATMTEDMMDSKTLLDQ